MQTTTMSPHGETVADLECALEIFYDIFGARVATGEIDTLCFCLRHLFVSADTLYRVTLADMALYQYSPDPDPATGHTLWLQLQEVIHIMERIEALCHLLNGGVVATLAALERTNSVQHPDDTSGQNSATDIKDELTHNDDQTPHPAPALNLLISYMQRWQHCQRFSFTQQLAQQVPLTFPLPKLDQALSVLLANLQTIFTQILPAFHRLAVYEDEKMAMLLLDLVQKSDQILLQINIMLEPCHLLLKRYVAVLTI